MGRVYLPDRFLYGIGMGRAENEYLLHARANQCLQSPIKQRGIAKSEEGLM